MQKKLDLQGTPASSLSANKHPSRSPIKCERPFPKKRSARQNTDTDTRSSTWQNVLHHSSPNHSLLATCGRRRGNTHSDIPSAAKPQAQGRNSLAAAEHQNQNAVPSAAETAFSTSTLVTEQPPHVHVLLGDLSPLPLLEKGLWDFWESGKIGEQARDR